MAENTIVLDCGSGYTKIGFSGESKPESIPTAIVGSEDAVSCLIGHEAQANASKESIIYPIKNKKIENWSAMESFLFNCFYKYLNIEPENQTILYSESPLNPPENRKQLTEIMFELFNIKNLNISNEAILSLYANLMLKNSKNEVINMTGTVIDSGDGMTQITSIVDGFIIGSSLSIIPITGKSITSYIQYLLRNKENLIPPEMSLCIAKKIKEKYCYISDNIIKENENYGNIVKIFEMKNQKNKNEIISIELGKELYLGPEIYFNSNPIFKTKAIPSLSYFVDESIQNCPIDTKRSLYKNIYLNGGSTLFPGFGNRLKKEIRELTNNRLNKNAKEIEVDVIELPMRKYGTWLGGSLLALNDNFEHSCITKHDYNEFGTNICLKNLYIQD